MTRIAIPPAVRQLVLIEAGYKCGNPTCRGILALELHHIEWVKEGGGNEPSNLLALCPTCHALHTRGHIPDTAIRVWKALLVALNSSNQGTADLLLALYQDELRCAGSTVEHGQYKFRFTGDGLPSLAGLMAASIIEISRRYSGANAWGGVGPSFEVSLTAKGKQLVENWRGGTEEVSSVLGGASAT